MGCLIPFAYNSVLIKYSPGAARGYTRSSLNLTSPYRVQLIAFLTCSIVRGCFINELDLSISKLSLSKLSLYEYFYPNLFHLNYFLCKTISKITFFS